MENGRAKEQNGESAPVTLIKYAGSSKLLSMYAWTPRNQSSGESKPCPYQLQPRSRRELATFVREKRTSTSTACVPTTPPTAATATASQPRNLALPRHLHRLRRHRVAGNDGPDLAPLKDPAPAG